MCFFFPVSVISMKSSLVCTVKKNELMVSMGAILNYSSLYRWTKVHELLIQQRIRKDMLAQAVKESRAMLRYPQLDFDAFYREKKQSVRHEKAIKTPQL